MIPSAARLNVSSSDARTLIRRSGEKVRITSRLTGKTTSCLFTSTRKAEM
jgi:transcription antitermination factor NusA-like protein